MNEPTRRRVLRSSGTALACGVTVGLGGCQASQDEAETTPDDGTDDGTDTGPDGDLPDYSSWLPAPSAFELPAYGFFTRDWTRIREYPQLEAEATRKPGSLSDIDGLSLEDMDSLYFLGAASVYRGSVDTDALESYMTDNGADDPDSLGDFSLYVSRVGHPAAVSEDAFVVATPSAPKPQAAVEAVVDAHRGEQERYAEVDDGVRTLLSHLGTGIQTVGGAVTDDTSDESSFARVDGVVATGTRWRTDGDLATATMPYVFESTHAADTTAIEEAFAESKDIKMTDVQARQTGRVVVATGTADPGQILDRG